MYACNLCVFVHAFNLEEVRPLTWSISLKVKGVEREREWERDREIDWGLGSSLLHELNELWSPWSSFKEALCFAPIFFFNLKNIYYRGDYHEHYRAVFRGHYRAVVREHYHGHYRAWICNQIFAGSLVPSHDGKIICLNYSLLSFSYVLFQICIFKN